MSMEICILSDRKLSSVESWQHAVDACGLNYKLSPVFASKAFDGIMSVQGENHRTSFEIRTRSAANIMMEMPRIDFGHRWKFAIELIWAGDINAGPAAYATGAAYAKATGGVVLDYEEGKLISPQRAQEIALEIEAQAPDILALAQRVVQQFRK